MDPIGNMLTSLKNAGLVKKATVSVPHSKLKVSILETLKQESYIKAYEVKEGVKPTINVVLDYIKGEPRINGVKRISKPGKRVYIGAKEISPVKYGHGVSIISTPKGILTDKAARKEVVGGEVLFTIW